MKCQKCTREMVEVAAKSTSNPYTRRFKCEWCRNSWEGIVNKVLYSPREEGMRRHERLHRRRS